MKAALLFLCLLRRWSTPTHARVSVVVSPDTSQLKEYEKVSVRCEQDDGVWTVWRYATDSSHKEDEVLSQCGLGWGSWTDSTCDFQVKRSDTGVYWCESEHGDSSRAINITVTDRRLILRKPVLPVAEGGNVTLVCDGAASDRLYFYKDKERILLESTGHVTIHNFSHADQGEYTCRSDNNESAPSWLLIDGGLDPVTLSVSPDSHQFFEYENVTLSCDRDNSSALEWRVKRAVITGKSGNRSAHQTCGDGPDCVLQTVKTDDSGVYWCESASKDRSNTVRILVHGGPLILTSPLRPVTAGANVTLSCRASPHLVPRPAHFYKDGYLQRVESAGHMTIHHVSKYHEGEYTCAMGDVKSEPSRLFVIDGSAAGSPLSTWRVICHLVVCSPYCASTVLMVSLLRQRPKAKSWPGSPEDDDVQYDDVATNVTAGVTTEHSF